MLFENNYNQNNNQNNVETNEDVFDTQKMVEDFINDINQENKTNDNEINNNEVNLGNLININDLSSRIILTTTNQRARDINNEIVARLPGEEKVYYARNTIPNKDEYEYDIDLLYNEEYLAQQNPGGCPPHELRLKINTIVMLLRNINTAIGLCNGTRMAIEKMNNETLECKVLSGIMKDKKVFIPKMTLTQSDTRLPISFQRRQFPICVSFAITINKSQGQTFNFVGVDLTNSVFSHGQLYVAASRCRSYETLKFQVPIYDHMIKDDDKEKEKEKKKNKRNYENVAELLGEDAIVTVKNVVFEQVIPNNNRMIEINE